MAKVNNPPYGDLEMGTSARGLYPGQTSAMEIAVRWSFIRKVYSILTLQLLLTAAVASVVVFVHPVKHFFVSSPAGIALYILFIFLPLIIMCPLYFYAHRHPVNLLLLALFTVCMGFAVGLTCAFVAGRIILESAILTTVVTISLTLYTFWAVKRGHDFSFLGPFLFAALIVLLVFILIQILVPLGKLSSMIYGAVASIIFCGFIIYDTNNLIERYTYDDYVWACVALYLDVINLFLSLLTLFRASE